jgi:2-C-methyl-D-erythritol 4-phosphate cytidylyltransferase/2-C-methyl-D-erythritol 2,4-cyclodiphosphate synthase
MNEDGTKIAVLIVAGGSGVRMDADIPKQYLPIHGKAIIRHTIEKFKKTILVQCVVSAQHEQFYQQAVEGLNILPAVIGGATRQASVLNGLKALEVHNPTHVLIHDAARPCVMSHDIHNVINSLNANDVVTLAQPLSETIQRNGENIDRDDVWVIQTPQGFSFPLIMDAHMKASQEGFIGTDDTSLTHHYGTQTHYIPCGRHNLKITTQDDLKMAQQLLSSTMETKIGNGFDVHAFDDANATHIRLCGVDIPHVRKLKGHSDADVGLHAITDAIFGALADGDIGSHFPPSDMTFKDMDSHVFLDKAIERSHARGGQINHIDVTFMCEEPKIGKHRDLIRNHLSDYLKLPLSRISVKATTTERLGFTGRGEGIACQAIVTIQVPTNE